VTSDGGSGGGAGSGIGLGVVLAVIMSWTANHSVLWAVAHGFLSWFYVVYRLAGCGE
jgi:hypothetical protein